MTAIALEQQRRDRNTSIILTVVLHLLLGILFLFVGMTEFDPPLKEQMIELIQEDTGGGLDGGMNDPNSGGGEPATAPASQEQPEDLATQEESPVEVPKPAKPTKPRQETPPAPRPNPNALFTPSNNPGPNDNGPPGGGPTPGERPGGGGTGNFRGEGFEGKLDGRGLARVPQFRNDNTDAGVVAVDIKVDATGKVISAKGKLDRPTTTTSRQLHQLAEGYAKQFQFSARSGSGMDQIGYIVFVFKLQ